MRISGIASHLNVDKIKKIDQEKKASQSSKKAPLSDSTNISSDAKRLNQTNADINTVKAHAQMQPDVRPEKVQEAKEKIKNGFYDSEKFMDQLAEKIMKDFGISS